LEDAARAIVLATFTGFEGEIVWDATKPDGQPRRMLADISIAKTFGYQPESDFK